MHLYPEDYEIVKQVAAKQKITIPEAAEKVITGNHRRLQHLQSHVLLMAEIISKKGGAI